MRNAFLLPELNMLIMQCLDTPGNILEKNMAKCKTAKLAWPGTSTRKVPCGCLIFLRGDKGWWGGGVTVGWGA